MAAEGLLTIGTHRVNLEGTLKEIRWSPKKDALLQATRGISFGAIAVKLAAGAYHDVIDSTNQARYPGQRQFVVEVGGYAYLVPFAESASSVFLKTIIPSRKATRRFVRRDPLHDH